MKKSKFREPQIFKILKGTETGVTVVASRRLYEYEKFSIVE
jgi:hypothetical protein